MTDPDPRMAAASVEAIRAMPPIQLNFLIAASPNVIDARIKIMAAQIMGGRGDIA